MGAMLRANCECGYTETSSTASGRRDHGKVFTYPHICHTCHCVVSADILEPQLTCPKCGSTDLNTYGVTTKPKLRSSFIVDATNCYVIDKTFYLTNDPYKCPKCRQYKLRFTVAGFFS
jgi:hypothetical protein